jgi:two-component system sensor kinase FixL
LTQEIEQKAAASPLLRNLLVMISFAIAFFILQRLTFLLRFPPFERTTLWVPGALTFSALLVFPMAGWWRFYVGLCVAAYAAYYDDPQISGPVALLSAQFHFAASAVGAWAIRRLTNGAPFATVVSMLVFVFAAAVLVPLATSVPGDLLRWVRGDVDVWPTATRSFLCVSLGMLIATPALTTTMVHGRDWLRSAVIRERLEVVALTTCLLAVGLWVFATSADSPVISALVYAPIPFLLWAALRFEVAGASWALLAIAYLSTWNAINGRGPFVGGSPDDHVLQLQLFLMSVSLPLLFMAVGVGERRRAFSMMVEEMNERRRMEERFRLVVESTPNAILMIGPSGRIISVNRQTEKLFGYSSQELIAQPWSDLFPDRFRARATACVREFFATPIAKGPGNGFELYGRRRDSTEFPLEIGLTPIDSADGTVALVAVTDNTERQRAEEARRELIHASRLAALSEFTASIAHEMNQPLGAILSNADAAEMLLESPSPPLDEVRRILVDIRNDDLRASNVIRSLRALLRRGEVERNTVEISRLVRDVATILRAEAQRRGIEVRLELATADLEVMGDRVHLQQVLLNLIINGMEAMQDSHEEKQLKISTAQLEDEVLVSVADRGCGVSPESIPRLFDRFFSTKKEGMGLGLAISRSLVEEHGGRIWVENAPERGAIVRFSLPLAPSPQPIDEEPSVSMVDSTP